MKTSSNNIILEIGESLFGGQLQKGDNLSKFIALVNNYFTLVDGALSLDCLNLKDYGIKCSEEDGRSLLCQLFEIILTNEQNLLKNYDNVLKYLTSVQKLVSEVESTKVKVTKESGTAKYLKDAFAGSANHLTYDSAKDVLVLKGLVPIGMRAYISPVRINDFDNTGKGKEDTDLAGWAIRNGSNGLDNALGLYVKTATSLEEVGQKKGNNSYQLSLSNIKSFTLGVKGSISETLGKIKPGAYIRQLSKRFGSGGDRPVLIPDDSGQNGDFYAGKEFDLKHTHGFSLNAAHENANPDPLVIELAHIKELPIEFIGF